MVVLIKISSGELSEHIPIVYANSWDRWVLNHVL